MSPAVEKYLRLIIYSGLGVLRNLLLCLLYLPSQAPPEPTFLFTNEFVLVAAPFRKLQRRHNDIQNLKVNK